MQEEKKIQKFARKKKKVKTVVELLPKKRFFQLTNRYNKDTDKFESFTQLFEKHQKRLNYVDLTSQVQKILQQFLAKFPQFKVKHSEDILKLSEFKSFFTKTHISSSSQKTQQTIEKHYKYFDAQKKKEFLDKINLFLINRSNLNSPSANTNATQNESMSKIQDNEKFIQCVEKLLRKRQGPAQIFDTSQKQYNFIYSKDFQKFLDTYLKLQQETPITFIQKQFKEFLKQKIFEQDIINEEIDDNLVNEFLNSDEMLNFFNIYVDQQLNQINQDRNIDGDDIIKIMLKNLIQKNFEKFKKDPEKFFKSKEFKNFISNFEQIQNSYSPFDFFKQFMISNKQCIKNIDELKNNPIFQTFLQYNSGGNVIDTDKFFDAFFNLYPDLKDKFPESILLSQQFTNYFNSFIQKQNQINKQIYKEFIEKAQKKISSEDNLSSSKQKQEVDLDNDNDSPTVKKVQIEQESSTKKKVYDAKYLRRLKHFNTVVTPFTYHCNTMKYLDLPFVNKLDLKKGLQEENIIMIFSPRLPKKKVQDI